MCGASWSPTRLGSRRRGQRRTDLRRDAEPIVDQPKVGDAAVTINFERDDPVDVDCGPCGSDIGGGLLSRRSSYPTLGMTFESTSTVAIVSLLRRGPACSSSALGRVLRPRTWIRYEAD